MTEEKNMAVFAYIKPPSEIKKFNYPINKFWLNNNNLIDYIVVSPGIDVNKCKIRDYLKKNLKKAIT